MVAPWRAELFWLIWLTLAAIFVGNLTDEYALAAWLASLLYLGRHLAHINRLLIWLRSGGRVPNGSGIWEEIYFLIYRLRRRNKRRKKRLLAMLERFRTATAALPDATVVLGPRDEIDWFNEAAEHMLGLRKSDIGQQIANLVRYPKFAEFIHSSDYQSQIGIPSPAVENMQLTIRIVPYGEDLRLLVAQDVTQLRFMERVRTDFVANVSHELRTPLTVLKGYVETLANPDGGLPERYVKIFARMQEQTLRMQNLIDGLLSLTRLESGPPPLQTPVNVVTMIKSICEEAQLLDSAHARVNLSIASAAKLLGVETELHSAFSNLVTNAIKYTPADGHINVCWSTDTSGAKLDVEDDGPGIAKEHLPRLTERFYRVDTGLAAGKGGVGLGLAIVKHVLVRHDAELSIESTPGQGSLFSCRFPKKRVLEGEGD